MTDPAALYEELQAEIETVLVGKPELVESLTISALTGGHVLLEGVPGVAKTTLAVLFARATGLETNRIQMTPDILPADITGTHVYRENTGEFVLQRGPIFTNLVVADEINRATPKTQSALLEAMQERHVTVEGDTLTLPDPFMVIATQNPIEMEGTFELPEAQRDRFQFKLTVDLPTRDEEHALLDRFDTDPTLNPDQITQVTTPQALLSAREAVADIHVADPVKDYILDLVTATRTSPDIAYGASPRASLTFLNTGKARAAIHGRAYVTPDDIKALTDNVLRHRIIPSTDAELSNRTPDTIIHDLVADVPPPSATHPLEP